jgi:hypothetical protein
MLLFLLFLIILVPAAVASDWKPIDPALLSKTVPTVEKDADVEGIFWEVSVADVESGGDLKTELKHYVRLKVFTERGKEYAKQVDISYPNAVKIKDIEARTIKPDGSIIELKKDSVFEKTLASIRKAKMKAKSFALPSIEPGVIVEYRWKEVRPFSVYSRLYLQRDIPIQSVLYHIKPYADTTYGVNTITFNAPRIQPQKESGGFYAINVENMPAFKEEPQMPPEDSVRAFVLVFYRESGTRTPAIYWNEIGKKRYESSKELLKPNGDVKKKTAEVIGNSTNPDEMIEKIFNYIRSNIKNIYDDASGFTPEQREKLKENKQPSDAIKRGIGTSGDMIALFGSMATAAGLDVRISHTGDRSDFFFSPEYADEYFLSNADIAIKVGNEWKIYDPSAAYLPLGMLRWGEEDNDVLIPDPKETIFIKTPLSPAEKSQEKGKADLKLSEDGTLEGDIVLEYTGHLGAEKKEYNDDDSPTQREETLKELYKERMSAAEITQIKIENVTDPNKPFTCRFHVRVPGYAQRTGKRIFFQPAFFQKGIEPLFPTNQRKHDIYFHYPWSELDEVEITLPAGYELESPEGRQPIKAGATGSHELRIMVSDDHQVVRCVRNFTFGGKNNILFSAKKYSTLKQLFDAIHEADNHTLTLKQTATR